MEKFMNLVSVASNALANLDKPTIQEQLDNTEWFKLEEEYVLIGQSLLRNMIEVIDIVESRRPLSVVAVKDEEGFTVGKWYEVVPSGSVINMFLVEDDYGDFWPLNHLLAHCVVAVSNNPKKEK